MVYLEQYPETLMSNNVFSCGSSKWTKLRGNTPPLETTALNPEDAEMPLNVSIVITEHNVPSVWSAALMFG